jgi:hypothetical protein
VTSLKARVTNHKGQTIVEAALTALCAMTIVVAGLQYSYVLWARVWVRHVLYEALICEMQQRRDCKQEALASINFFIPIQDRNRRPKIELHHVPYNYRGDIRVYLSENFWAGDGTTLHRPRPSRGGFVFLPFLIPLAAVLLVSFSLAVLFINEYAKHEQICRDAVLEANQKIENGIQNILDLNPRILALQLERDALEASARVDPEPYSQAAIQAKIQINQVQQIWMTVKQNLLKQAALAQSRMVLGRLRAEAASEGAGHMNHPRPQLKLKAEDTWHTAKQQSRGFTFSSDHEISARWKVSTQKYVRIFSNSFAPDLQIRCVSTIRREGWSWIPMLAM